MFFSSPPMASISIVFLVLSITFVAGRAQPNEPSRVRLGTSLTYPTSWPSPSHRFAFGFYPQGSGFAVGIWLVGMDNNITVVWTANRDDPPVTSKASLDFTKDGKLVLRTEQGPEQVIASGAKGPASYAVMNDSGNFVLYNNDSKITWQSFDSPTDTILQGQTLLAGAELASSLNEGDHSTGRFHLRMQTDGNLVSYPRNSGDAASDAYWNTGTSGSGFNPNGFLFDLYLNSTGGLNLVNQSNSATVYTLNDHLFSSGDINLDNNNNTIYRATLDVDGIFRLYSHTYNENRNDRVHLLLSTLENSCDIHDFCGLNSYCSAIGSKAGCSCYPGFDFINTSNKFLGCHQNFNEDDCRRSEDPEMLYNVASLENMSWADRPYSVKLIEERGCGKSCLVDCNCGAVLYTDTYCSKYKLPLRYGRIRNVTKPTTAFFKVYHPHQVHEVLIESKRSLILILSIILGSFLCLCLVLATSSILVYRHKFDRYRKLTENVNLGLAEEFTLRLFSYNELESATEGFQEELGRGSYGAVYKGTISEGGKTIVVKRLEKDVEEGDREFRAEIIAIARTHHKNLVRVLGICIEGNRKLLVYEYMNNGSLADLIFKAERPPIWKERIRIALDVARGLLYLHEESEVRIIHCNIKPQNILMDDNWTAKISDFGFAKLLMPNQSGATTTAEGTSAYLAPEWEKNSLISFQTDIYSLGVVLLEIVCCRRSIEVNVSTTDEIILSSWVYDCFAAGELDKLVKDETVDFRTLERMVKVGLWCVQEDPTLRPSMKNVVLMLEGTINVPIPPSPVLSIVVS
ncbi:G-type lectin S-receptor-like serine/threonine-protein kinase LECRK3 [Castanea sativa]|uniref:G-type lectin S-receptor-like serine/threonine-protein kinase LECRK3 n=1 Tax=Castanea sativa TaxID=21020 RepID=UPI003F652A04